MFNLPEVGETVNVTVTGQVERVVPTKDEDGDYEFQVYVKAPDGDTYVINVPRLGVSISKPSKANYITYTIPCTDEATAKTRFWKNG